MNKEQILGIIRHVLTAIGSILTLKGILDEATAMAIIGAIMTTVSGIWSIVDKSNQSILNKAEKIRIDEELKKGSN